ncbi:hypothetical protein KDW_18080 [Dictyobacter vulcani]|uniref:Pentapeptide repeat-containing protein n=1 Tax=Dictyobacter vulcani TaxID=2607529 RepID=A0A5J4KR12_9CHLR|nr:pentapeptide repeat-containing protein [Dictyobacter vulcani]GER87646.1 hypothetical protein KDW_18080 [Dictyobacter vulcani]
MSKIHSWWQKARRPLAITLINLFFLGLIVLIALVMLGSLFQWQWTGFGPETSDPKQHAKTLWDWLQLLIIPAVLAIGGYVFNLTSSRNEQKSTQVRDQTERDIAADNQREAALQVYVDKMSELLLDRNLRGSEEKDEVRKIARVRTLTILPRLDPARKRSIIEFIYEADLLDKDKPILNLRGADLREADLSYIDLSGANLRGINIHRANLSGADLRDVNLRGSKLNGAILRGIDLNRAYLFGVDFSGADLQGARLSDTNLSEAQLINANLHRASLSGAQLINANLHRANLNGVQLNNTNLSGAFLRGADLSGADLQGADLNDANLNNANLSGANLSGAELRNARNITVEQLHKTMSHPETAIPDGSLKPS